MIISSNLFRVLCGFLPLAAPFPLGDGKAGSALAGRPSHQCQLQPACRGMLTRGARMSLRQKCRELRGRQIVCTGFGLQHFRCCRLGQFSAQLRDPSRTGCDPDPAQRGLPTSTRPKRGLSAGHLPSVPGSAVRFRMRHSQSHEPTVQCDSSNTNIIRQTRRIAAFFRLLPAA